MKDKMQGQPTTHSKTGPIVLSLLWWIHAERQGEMARAAPEFHAKDMPSVPTSKFSFKFNVQSLQIFSVPFSIRFWT